MRLSELTAGRRVWIIRRDDVEAVTVHLMAANETWLADPGEIAVMTSRDTIRSEHPDDCYATRELALIAARSKLLETIARDEAILADLRRRLAAITAMLPRDDEAIPLGELPVGSEQPTREFVCV